MSCEICGRGACTRTFHSIAKQEAFDSEAGAAERALFDKIADLELTCRAQTGAITALRAALDQERADNERLRAFANMAAKIAVEMSDDEFGLSVELEHAGLIDEEGNPTALLSGRGHGGNDE
jgi:hypothetical protein